MDPFTVAIICAAVFGGVVALSSFIRQLRISRDRELNDHAQRRALKEEMLDLERLRHQMEGAQRYKLHYDIFGENKDAIVYLDNKIEEIIQRKSRLIERYGQVTLQESNTMIDKGVTFDRKAYCDCLKDEIDSQMACYDEELKALQKQRAALWNANGQFKDHLIEQESRRNQQLDDIYKRHTGILEKMFLRHIDNSEAIAKETLKSGDKTFKMMITAPLEFLKGYFKPSLNVSKDQFAKEILQRKAVEAAERDLNGPDSDDVIYSQDHTVESEVVNYTPG